MESLTSSCSKAVFDGLRSSSKRLVSAFHLSDRLEFPFSNDKVGNFRFLQMVQNKGISSLHAVPYESQMDLETDEPQAQQTDFAEETTFVRIKFQLQKDCKFGEHFLIVGGDPMMGAWDPSNALPMTWSEGHQWFVEMDVPAGKPIQYKFVLKSVSGNVIWQPGSDRVVKTWETFNRITVCEDWETADLQKIVEEERLDYSNVKPLTASELPTLSEKWDLPEAEAEEEEEVVSNVINALDIEDSKTHFVEEKQPLVQPDMQQIIDDITSSSSREEPMVMVAENIDSSEFTPRRRGVNNMAVQSEVTVHDLEQMGKVSQVNNQGKEDEKVNNLFEVEESPVLVPGLTPPKSEEATYDDVEERVTMDKSVEAVETKDQNMSEVLFNEEQEESDDGRPQEKAETLSDEPELVDKEFQDKFHSTTAIVKESDDGEPQEKAETLSDEPELVDKEFQDKFHSTSAIVKESDDGKPQEKAETLSDEPELVDKEFQDKFHSTSAIVKESDDGKPQEKAETLSDEPELKEFQNKFQSTTAIVKLSEVDMAHENVLESDIQWGRGIFKKLLSKLGLLKILQ